MAPRTSVRPTYVKGRRMRATKVDACGRPVFGDYGMVVSDGFISVAYSAVTTSTDAISVVNANGDEIANDPEKASLSGYGIEITFGNVDPEVFTLLTGMPLVLDADGNSVGISIDTKIDLSDIAFALELWTGVIGEGDACSDEAASGNYGYFISPLISGGYLSDFSIENGALNMVITGAATRDGNAWGKGPYKVQLNNVGGNKVAGPLIDALTSTTPLRLFRTEVAPPAALTGSRPLLDPAADPITSITATKGTGRSVSIAAIPDPTAGDGVWYDFGDGEWDYDDSGADYTHVYEVAGTYTIAASTNGTWVTTTVTVA